MPTLSVTRPTTNPVTSVTRSSRQISARTSTGKPAEPKPKARANRNNKLWLTCGTEADLQARLVWSLVAVRRELARFIREQRDELFYWLEENPFPTPAPGHAPSHSAGLALSNVASPRPYPFPYPQAARVGLDQTSEFFTLEIVMLLPAKAEVQRQASPITLTRQFDGPAVFQALVEVLASQGCATPVRKTIQATAITSVNTVSGQPQARHPKLVIVDKLKAGQLTTPQAASLLGVSWNTANRLRFGRTRAEHILASGLISDSEFYREYLSEQPTQAALAAKYGLCPRAFRLIFDRVLNKLLETLISSVDRAAASQQSHQQQLEREQLRVQAVAASRLRVSQPHASPGQAQLQLQLQLQPQSRLQAQLRRLG